MRNFSVRSMLTTLLLSVAWVSCAHAQFAVIDPAAIVQLLQEVSDLEQMISAARNQLEQARQALQTMTGDRGMESLLSGTNRNYLPSNWSQLSGAVGSGSGTLGADVQGNVAANAVLSPQRLSMLSPDAQQLIQTDRQWGATRQSISHEALSNASGRFASLQTLISKIGSAGDQKSILDLQARINAELGMLQNEQTKLQALNQTTLAQESVQQQRRQELAIQAQGRFETRFQPTP